MSDVYSYPASMRRLVNELSKLPSIGLKSAVRLAHALIEPSNSAAEELAGAIVNARKSLRYCEECFSLTESALCSVCEDDARSRATICVVEKPSDLISIERSGDYNGLYHVLHGLWSPMRGVEPSAVRINELAARLEKLGCVEEVILATSTTVEGDATAMYIANMLKDQDVRVTRLAQGLPMGGELEYADELTLSHALAGRQAID
ncbi:MAG: recombination protein RecR [Bdellovibrionales bacterium]|nr:recombination protein RecR [Bdellovibrionales bacterium]